MAKETQNTDPWPPKYLAKKFRCAGNIWQCVRSGFNLPAMRFSPWILLSATSLSRRNHLFQKRKKRGRGYDISSAANFFFAIKWPWLVKLLADNMLNIVLKRKREFLDFFRFFSKNSNFWKNFKYVIWSIVYPWKANGLTVKMSMILQLIYQVWGALWMFSSIAAKFNPELAVCPIQI